MNDLYESLPLISVHISIILLNKLPRIQVLITNKVYNKYICTVALYLGRLPYEQSNDLHRPRVVFSILQYRSYDRFKTSLDFYRQCGFSVWALYLHR